MENLSKNLLIFVLGLLLVCDIALAYNGTSKVVVEGDYIEAGQTESLGGFYSPDIIGLSDITETVAFSLGTSTKALRASDTGKTYLLSASSTTITLPAVEDGLEFKFQINGAINGGNMIIDSAEGDNIEGTLIVAGAVVDCAGEDQLNFVGDGENVGDYVELMSDGTQWLLGDSGVLTAGKLTCTDPS